MKTVFKLAAVTVVCVTFSTSAFADCVYAGKNYSTGAVIPAQECTANGTWVQR